MTYLVDTEGEDLPADSDGRKSFDVNFQCDQNGVPYLSVGVPMYFEVLPEHEGGIYCSGGVLTVDFKAVMEEYLSEIRWQDGGAYAKSIASYLREYADRLDAVEVSAESEHKGETDGN